jgi:predicted ATPase/class 3 adenylate cyclase
MATTLTFLFTDLEGSTVMLRHLGEAYTDVLADHHRLIRGCLASHGGNEISTQGDGFFAIFTSPSASVAAVMEMQRAIGSHHWPAGARVRVRMGIHTGEASETAVGLVGLDVHRAARIAAVAHGGQVVMSGTTAALVAGSMPAGAALKNLGRHRLKDLGQPEQIFQLEADGIETDFPPLRSLDNPELLHNLPERLTSFVGREREQGELRALISSHRLVTLTGPGGSGKTRLVLQIAAELLDGNGDGVWLVELAGLSDPDQVVSAIADVFRVKPQADRSVLETLIDALSHRNLLLVLDNCEHVVVACAKACDAILRSCPTVHVLATSREPLGIDGETIYRVQPLSLPPVGVDDVTLASSSDAVRLFVERASANQPSFALDEKNTALVLSLCRRLDGIPLALELAAARLRSLSLTKVHDNLDDRFRLLTGGSRSALPRQQTLLATVEWSYDLLNPAERRLLRRLSVFSGGFDLEAAEALCSTPDDDLFGVLDHLGSLVDKSLVAADTVSSSEVRYGLLETIRQYARGKLRDEDGSAELAALDDAHAYMFVRLAEAAEPHLRGPAQIEWLHHLDSERDNLRAAAAHLLGERGDTRAALRLARSLRRYWLMRDAHHDGLAVYDALSSRPELGESSRVAAEVLSGHSWLVLHGDVAKATQLNEAALRVARELRDDALISGSLCVLAHTKGWLSGDQATYEQLWTEAVATARTVGDPFLLALILGNGTTRRDFEESLAISETLGDRFGQAWMLSNLASLGLLEGDTRQARRHAEGAVTLFETLGIVDEASLLNLSMALVLAGDWAAARSSFVKALRSARLHFNDFYVGYGLLGIALCDSADGRLKRASRLHGAVDAQVERHGAPLEAFEQQMADEDRARLTGAMGEPAFADAYESGRQMQKESAINLALRADQDPEE